MGGIAVAVGKAPAQNAFNAQANQRYAAAQGIPGPIMPFHPIGIAFRVVPYGLTVLSYMYAAVFGLLSLLVTLSLIFTACTGRVSKWMRRIDAFLGSGNELDEKTLQTYSPPRAVLEIVVQLVLALLQAFFRLAALLFVFLLPMLVLFLLMQAFMQAEMYPDSAFSSATSTQLAARRVWNVAGGFVNTALDINNVLAVFYNVYVNGLIPFVRIIYQLIVDPIIHADGDFSNNPLYDEVEGFVKSGVNENTVADLGGGIEDTFGGALGLTGRRALTPASLGITGGQQFFQLLSTVARLVALILDLYFFLRNQFYRLLLTLIYPFMPYIGDIVVLVSKSLICVFHSPVCALLELLNYIVQAIFFVINNVFIATINAALSIFGDADLLGTIEVSSVACTAEDLVPGVPCDCRLGGVGEGGVPGIYSNMPSCEKDQWSCAETSDGQFQEVRTSQGVSTVMAVGDSRATTCTHVRRALSADGHHANMAEHGYYGCYDVCVNQTLIEACPPALFSAHGTPHSLVVADDHRPCGGPAPLDDDAEHRRRLDMHVNSLNDVVHRAFAVQHESVRVTTRHAQRAAQAQHRSEREAKGAAMTRKQFEHKFAEQYKDGDVLSRQGGVACQVALNNNNGGGGDTMVSRYFETMCLVQTGAERSRPSGARGMAYVSSAARAYAQSATPGGAHRRRMQATQSQGLDVAHSMLAWGENVMLKSAKVGALRHSRERLSPAEKLARLVDILDAPPTKHMADVHRRLGTETPHRVAVDRTTELLRAGAERWRALVDLEFPSPAEETHRRRRLARGPVLTLGIFQSEPRCQTTQYECPDGTCVAARKNCQRIPGQPAGFVEEINWLILDLVVALEQASDVGALLAQWNACWELYEHDDSINPFSLSNVGKTDEKKTNVVWCFPYFEGVTWRAELNTFNLDTWTKEQCNTVAADGVTVTNGCTCDLYYDKHLQMNINERWLPGVPIFEYARLHNGLLSVQYILTGYITRDTWLDRFWQSMWPAAYYPLWWSRLFGDQGHAGTENQQFLCAYVHLGSAFYTLQTLLLFLIGAVATVPPALKLLRRWGRILQYLLLRGASRATRTSVIGEPDAEAPQTNKPGVITNKLE